MSDASPAAWLLPEDEQARAVLAELSKLERAGRLGQLDTRVLDHRLGELSNVLAALEQETGAPVRLTASGPVFFVNGRQVRAEQAGFQTMRECLEGWRSLGLGEVVFPAGVKAGDLAQFARALATAAADPGRAPALFAQPWGGVTLRPAGPQPAAEDPRASARQAVQLYCFLLVLLRRALRALASDRSPDLRPIRRVLAELIDGLQAQGGLLMALARCPGLAGQPETHLASSAMLALIVGRWLRLGPSAMICLALGAVMHHAPRACRCAETGPGEPPGSGLLDALARLACLEGLSEKSAGRLAVVHEALLQISAAPLAADGGGHAPGGPALLPAILAVSCLYDTLTRAGAGQAGPGLSEAVLKAAASQLDPRLVRVLVEIMGVYPTGSLVQLQSGQVGVVVSQRRGFPLRPQVLVVLDSRGQRVSGPLLDLSTDARVQIACPVDGTDLGLNPVACFLG